MAIKYWLAVAHRDHVRRSVDIGVLQVGARLRAALDRMGEADGLVCYSPRTRPEGERLQAFTAVGRLGAGRPFQPVPGDDRPWRRQAEYETDAVEASIRPLLPVLDLSREHVDWGFRLRDGLLEISRRDFELVRRQMRRPSADDR